jgi:hypothetical protein
MMIIRLVTDGFRSAVEWLDLAISESRLSQDFSVSSSALRSLPSQTSAKTS